MTTHRARVQPGIPAGGQFATQPRLEGAVTLQGLGPDLTTLSEQDVDARAEQLYLEHASAGVDLTRAASSARSMLKHRRSAARNASSLPHGGWPMSEADTLTALEDAAKDMDAWAAERAVQVLERARSAAQVMDSSAEGIAACETEWARRGHWSRFFIVTSSAGGHIHSSRGCSTCRPSTQFGWLPALSNKDEAAAVAACGALLCSTCFPSAPVEWTDGRGRRDADGQLVVDATCPGSNGRPTGETRQFGRSRYGTCPACGGEFVVGYSGLRKHKSA